MSKFRFEGTSAHTFRGCMLIVPTFRLSRYGQYFLMGLQVQVPSNIVMIISPRINWNGGYTRACT
ncbi:hypothetical protein HYALB_00003051 [Hymenoscyphus albidus]|uniref:Uncharacterized protein n=1 Tax=Hymenoscyphus albidus TaxID=595503 RepID=A0A9N9Q6C0_9HELO|nr:hypothetical protein HYALB_00003051 [Hymenoscyphus albidus]